MYVYRQRFLSQYNTNLSRDTCQQKNQSGLEENEYNGECWQLVNLKPGFDEYCLKNRSFFFDPQITPVRSSGPTGQAQITRIVKVVKREGVGH